MTRQDTQAPASRQTAKPALAWTLLVSGLLLLLLAWSMPFNLASLTPPLLRRAAADTPRLSDSGLNLVRSEKSGPATLFLKAARSLGDPGAPSLEKALETLRNHNTTLVAWGGWDPYIDPLVKLLPQRTASTPLIEILVTRQARKQLADTLANSRSIGAQTFLKLRTIKGTGNFVPASQPGGQVLDTLLLTTALLYQGEHLSSALQRELRNLGENAANSTQLGALEPLLFDLLSLSKRLDWVQLCELLRYTDDTKTVGEYAHLARIAPEDFTLIYAAALHTASADRVAAYLLKFGKTGLSDLRDSLLLGQGATKLLLERQLPINHSRGADLGEFAILGILHPRLALAARWTAFLSGAFLILLGIDRLLFRSQPGFGPALPHLKGGTLALLLAAMLAMATEPFLLRGSPVSEFKLRLAAPVLVVSNSSQDAAKPATFFNMDTSTLLSICVFASLQVAMYLACLFKIREIDRQSIPSSIKLELMNNEENLFDGGLYIGIAGTAAALVLQVLGMLEANLLAAYSSNLFGIVCVAFVKIRHVRPYKRSLILAARPSSSGSST